MSTKASQKGTKGQGDEWNIRALPDKWSLHRVQENKAYNKNAAQK
jgi:hypothetical protein